MKKKRAEPKNWRKKVVAGFIISAIGIYSIGVYENFEMHAIHTSGHIIDLQHESQRTGRRGNTITSYRPTVRFTVPGTEKKLEMKTVHASTRYDFSIGSEVDIEFDPSDPEKTLRIDSGLSSLDLGVTIIGLAVMGLGIYENLEWRRSLKA